MKGDADRDQYYKADLAALNESSALIVVPYNSGHSPAPSVEVTNFSHTKGP